MSQLVTEGASLRQAFGKALVSEAERGVQFLITDMDVAGGTLTSLFRDRWPERFIQCSIAEQGALGVSAGLALSTGEPVVYCTFSSFGLRAYEIAKLSVFYNQANVKLCFSHNGLDTGPDGASAQELCHYACWRAIPGSIVLHPCSSLEMNQAVAWMLAHEGPVVLFTGRSPVAECLPPDYQFEFGKIQPVAGQGNIALIFATGNEVAHAVEAEKILGNSYGIEVSVYNVSTLKPMDAEGLAYLVKKSQLWFSVEDHAPNGGLHAAITEVSSQLPRPPRVVPIAVPSWGESGEADQLRHKFGLDAAGIVNKVLGEI